MNKTDFKYKGYLRPYGYTELMEDLYLLKAIHPDRVSLRLYGKSAMGRLLPLVKIGRGQRKLLIIGSVHGREFVSSAFIMRSVFELLKEESKEVAELLDKNCLYLCPMANPDGVEIALLRDKPCVNVENFNAELYKNNANNINLNANFPFFFSCVPKDRQGGKKPCSEPESAALINLCKKEIFTAALSLHVRGNCIFWRDMGNGTVKGDFALAAAFRDCCGFNLVSPTKKAEDFSGGFENWFRYAFKRPALCIELVEDEKLSFTELCTRFDEAVLWDRTKELLKVFLKGETLRSD